jgi:NAD(P)-dependent dehydrogenase (short-subunit alcohol dehydrogenase family)
VPADSGRAVLVSGATTGIGRTATALLAQHGFTVFAGHRRPDAGSDLERVGAGVTPIRLDVTDPECIARAVACLRDSGVPLHGVVNNAGVALGGPLECVPPNRLRDVFETNVIGAVALTQACLPLLRATRGRVVFVGSIAGRISWPYSIPYNASKFALRAVADGWRVELASSGIAVSLVEPGNVRTPIWRKAHAAGAEVVAASGSDLQELYGPHMRRVLAGLAEAERSGMPPEPVAHAILHALTSARPRTSYPVGARLALLLALLPPGLRDRILVALLDR